MKRYLKSYSLLFLLGLLLAGCSDETFVETKPGQGGGQVDVLFSVAMAPTLQTRSMDGSDSPTITSLYLAVFDSEHYLSQIAKATPTDALGNELTAFTPVTEGDGVEVTYFKVTLDVATGVSIHLVANKDISQLPFGSEGQIIGTLQTANNEDVYWQRVENVTIPAAETNQEIVSNTIDAATKVPELVRVPLVRNYAKVTVTNNSTATFQITGIALSNLADRGTVAPRISSNTFANYWKMDGSNKVCRTYLELLSQGYSGNEAGDEVLSDELVWSAQPTDPFCIYEHKNVNADKTVFIIIKGKYAEDGNFNGPDVRETYYKMDLVYKDQNNVTQYYNILRNLWYNLVITEVLSDGYTEESDAVENPASNNLSGSTVVSELTNISDGVGHLFVDRTSIVIVDSNPVTFKYLFKPDLENRPNAVDNSAVTVSLDQNEDQVVSSYSVATTEDNDGWRVVTITPNAPTDEIKFQNVVVTGTNSEGETLDRTVRLTLRKPFNMRVECDPKTLYKTYNSPVRVNIYIPTGLPLSYFPLDFHISSSNNSIYPQANTDMPTIVSDGSYAFSKQVREVDYENMEVVDDAWKVVVCDFMVNSNAAGQTTVNVTNQYFNPASDTFNQSETAVLNSVGIEATEYYGVGHPVTLKYNLAQAASSLSVTLNEGSTSTTIDVASLDANYLAVGDHTITVETETFGGDISFTVAATRTGGGGASQTTTVHAAKKRHILLLPAGSFRFTASMFPSNRWRTDDYTWPAQRDAYHEQYLNQNFTSTDAIRTWAAGYNCTGYEYPDLIIDSLSSGSFPVWANTGMVNTMEVDANYGGRHGEYTANSVVQFITHYNFYDLGDGNGMYTHPARVFVTTMETLTNWYAEHNHSLEGFNLWTESNYSNSDTATESWHWQQD